MECSDHHLHGAGTAAPPGLCSPCVGGAPSTRGRAGMACVPGASGLKNQVLSALGLPEPTEHPLSHTCSVCHVQALGWGQCHKSPFRAVQGAGRVTQALSG